MKDEYLTFRRFSNAEDAEDLAALLKQQNISYQVEDASTAFDGSAFGHAPLEKQMNIKIKSSEFEIAEKLLLDRADVDLGSVPEDYYLFSFSNEELIEILMKPDEWGDIDHQLSKKILKDRGKPVDEEFIQTLKKKRNEELSKPERKQKAWVRAGYIFALLGGLIGVFIGWHLYTFKKTLPNGQRVYGYIESDRKHGKTIMVIGVIFFVIGLFIQMNQ